MGNQPEFRSSMGKAPSEPRRPLFASQSPRRDLSAASDRLKAGTIAEGLLEAGGVPNSSAREKQVHLARQVDTAARLGHNFAKLPVQPGNQASSPIQRAARLRHFVGRRTRMASRRNGVIGSVYSQYPDSRFNRGQRIRLEHDGGPHLSSGSTYRHTLRNGRHRHRILGNGRVGRQRDGRLVETRTPDGPIMHRSRGRLVRMPALSDEQARALFRLAQTSDRHRAEIGPGLRYADEDAHAAEHNRRTRVLLRRALFERHPLGEGQADRDRLPGAPYP